MFHKEFEYIRVSVVYWYLCFQTLYCYLMNNTAHVVYYFSHVSLPSQSDARSRKNNIENVSLFLIAVALRVVQIVRLCSTTRTVLLSFSMKQTVLWKKTGRKGDHAGSRTHDLMIRSCQAIPAELLRCVTLLAATTIKATCTKLLALLAHSENSTSGRFDCATNLSKKDAWTNERNLARTRDNYADTVLRAVFRGQLE